MINAAPKDKNDKRTSNNGNTGKTADAIPSELVPLFIEKAYEKAELYGDMFTLTTSLGLRTSEARELSASHIDLKAGVINLTDSKQVRSYVTKQANKIIDGEWLTQGRIVVRETLQAQGMDFQNAVMMVNMQQDTKQLKSLALQFMPEVAFEQVKDEFFASRIEQARSIALRSAPKGRTVKIRNEVIRTILEKRIERYGDSLLFPSSELKSNRASKCVAITRQTIARIVKAIREELESMSTNIKEALDGISLGAHSARKYAVQQVIEKVGMLEASVWVGHGNGDGNLATTEKYMNKSQKKINAIEDQLTAMGF